MKKKQKKIKQNINNVNNISNEGEDEVTNINEEEIKYYEKGNNDLMGLNILTRSKAFILNTVPTDIPYTK